MTTRVDPAKSVYTFQKFQMVGDLLQDGEAGQHQAEGALLIRPGAALWLVPLASLQHSSQSDAHNLMSFMAICCVDI